MSQCSHQSDREESDGTSEWTRNGKKRSLQINKHSSARKKLKFSSDQTESFIGDINSSNPFPSLEFQISSEPLPSRDKPSKKEISLIFQNYLGVTESLFCEKLTNWIFNQTWNHYNTFRVEGLAEVLLDCSNVCRPEENDIHNLQIMLDCLSGNGMISVTSLAGFLCRFGKLSFLLKMIKDFVVSGAKYWYHGPLVDKKSAENILRREYDRDHTLCYLIRDSSELTIEPQNSLPPECCYCFAISWTSSSSFIVKHTKIYLTPTWQYVVPVTEDNTQTSRCYATLGDFIKSFTDDLSLHPCANPRYSALKGLSKLPNIEEFTENIYSDEDGVEGDEENSERDSNSLAEENSFHLKSTLLLVCEESPMKKQNTSTGKSVSNLNSDATDTVDDVYACMPDLHIKSKHHAMEFSTSMASIQNGRIRLRPPTPHKQYLKEFPPYVPPTQQSPKPKNPLQPSPEISPPLSPNPIVTPLSPGSSFSSVQTSGHGTQSEDESDNTGAFLSLPPPPAPSHTGNSTGTELPAVVFLPPPPVSPKLLTVNSPAKTSLPPPPPPIPRSQISSNLSLPLPLPPTFLPLPLPPTFLPPPPQSPQSSQPRTAGVQLTPQQPTTSSHDSRVSPKCEFQSEMIRKFHVHSFFNTQNSFDHKISQAYSFYRHRDHHNEDVFYHDYYTLVNHHVKNYNNICNFPILVKNHCYKSTIQKLNQSNSSPVPDFYDLHSVGDVPTNPQQNSLIQPALHLQPHSIPSLPEINLLSQIPHQEIQNQHIDTENSSLSPSHHPPVQSQLHQVTTNLPQNSEFPISHSPPTKRCTGKRARGRVPTEMQGMTSHFMVPQAKKSRPVNLRFVNETTDVIQRQRQLQTQSSAIADCKSYQ